jgi:hypothetical protein
MIGFMVGDVGIVVLVQVIFRYLVIRLRLGQPVSGCQS